MKINPLNYSHSLYDFSYYNYNSIRSSLIHHHYRSTKFENLCINKAVDVFYQNIFKIIDVNCIKKQNIH